MKTKIAPAMTVLSFELKTSLQSMDKDVGEIPKEIYQEAAKANLLPSGPQHWVYKWKSSDPNSEFVLKIALPVALFGNSYSGKKFKLENLESFKCLSTEHIGTWNNLKETYAKVMDKIKHEGLIPGTTNREVYINCDFENTENNITEIQFELN